MLPMNSSEQFVIDNNRRPKGTHDCQPKFYILNLYFYQHAKDSIEICYSENVFHQMAAN